MEELALCAWKKSITADSSLRSNGAGPNDVSPTSLAVSRAHGSTAPGALIARLSIPWRFSKGDDEENLSGIGAKPN
jgi:hypothetical protein